MDHLDPKQFICTQPINIRTYFTKYSETLKDFSQPPTKDHLQTQSASKNALPEAPTHIMGVPVSKEQLAMIAKTCNIANLGHPDEIPQVEEKLKIWEPFEHLSENCADGHLKIQQLKMKTRPDKGRAPLQILSEPSPRGNPDDEDLTPEKHIVVVVRLYKPYLASSRNNRNLARYTHEFAILGHQTLADLRDQFKCCNDYVSAIEIAHPDDEVTTDAKEKFPSGFIHIENCFYNDMRHRNAIDYSKNIIDWAKSKNIADFTQSSMDTTKIMDLSLRLGYPYMYQHQADCQHLLVFTDVRLLRNNELLDSSKYPYVLSVNYFIRRRCVICTDKYAQFIVTDCERLIHKYNYMCKTCLLIYNYRDGEKIGSFKLYPYFDITLILNE